MTRRINAIWRLSLALVAAVLATWPADSALAQSKRALVIGNGAYTNVSPLTNPVNDAADLSSVLRSLGFVVDQHADLGQIELLRALQDFQREAMGADIALIYYAGHGIEVERRNYLIPVDADLRSDRDINFRSVPLDLAIQAVEGAGKLSVVIMDACRDNPFLKQMTRTTRSIGRGLAAVEPEGNTLVAYAAKEGTVALDGAARNSPYAAALMQTLQEPGVEIGKVFRRVRDRVLETTNGAQEPFLYGSLSAEDIYLNPPVAREAPPPAAVSALTVPVAEHAVEITFWNSIAGSGDPRDFEDYLSQYPNGSFAGLATRRLEALSAPPPDPAPATRDAQVAAADPAAEPARSAAYRPTRAEVREVQERLNALDHDAGPVDGSFGPRTARAIEDYQRARGETPNGVISEKLITDLRADVTPGVLSEYRAAVAKAAAARQSERAHVAPTPAASQPTPVKPPVEEAADPPPVESATSGPPAKEPEASSIFGGSATVNEPDYSDGFQRRRKQREQRDSWSNP